MEELVVFLIAAGAYILALYLFFRFIAYWVLLAGGLFVALYVLWVYVNNTRVVLLQGTVAPVIPPENTSTHAGEPAYGEYFYGQALADLRAAIVAMWSRGRADLVKGAEAINDNLFQEGAVLFTWPIGVTAYGALVVGAVAGTAALALMALAHTLLVLTVLLIARVSALALRAVDSALLRIRNIRMVCPTCHERVPYPSYRCSDCNVLHQDVRPGRYGVIRRRCKCGKLMPTLLVFGSHRLEPFCPHHLDRPERLSQGVGKQQELSLPFAGATAAGKTRLMTAMIYGFEHDNSFDIEFPEPESRRLYEELRDVVIADRPLTGTQARMPRGYDVALHRGNLHRLLHFFDVAGELTQRDMETAAELRYLRHARTFLLFVDATLLQGDAAQRAAAVETLEAVAANLINAVQAQGRTLEDSRVAILLSKWDLLDQSRRPADVSSDTLQVWTSNTFGMEPVARLCSSRFGDVRYFPIASVVHEDRRVDDSVRRLADWVLEGKA